MIDQLLRDARPEVAPPDPVVTRRARRALLRTALARRTRRRYAVRTAIVLGAAASVVTATFVAQTPKHGASAAAVAILDRSADTLDAARAPLPGEYRYSTTHDLYWDYGPSPSDPTVEDTAPRSGSTRIETWVPTDPTKPMIQRTTDAASRVSWAVVDQDDNPAWKLFRDPPPSPAGMLQSLRDLERRTGSQDPDDNGVIWGCAFSLMWDPQTPDSTKADILRALALMDGVTVADRHARIGDRVGVALRYDEKYPIDFVFDPANGSLIGFRGHPERGPDWVGPDEPTFTTVFESRIVDSAPRPPEHLLRDVQHVDGPAA
jgi:hypothetical protein